MKERNKYIRSAPKTDVFKACLRSMAECDLFITLWKAKAKIVAATGVSASQQLIRVVPRTLEYSR
jgi:hypothetical protein